MRCLRRRRRGTFCVPSTRRRRSKKRNSDACPERRPTSRKRARRWRGWVESTGPWSNAWASDVPISGWPRWTRMRRLLRAASERPGHLRRGARLSTHAGGVGGDECGAGRRVSRWQCAGADGALERGASCLRRSAENGEDLLLSGGFGLSGERTVEVAARREAGGRAGRLHWLCDQRADERGAASSPRGGPGGRVEAVSEIEWGGDARVCGGAVRAGREVGA